MSNRAWLIATTLLLAANLASPVSGQFVMGGVVGGPLLGPPRNGSFFFGIGPPALPPSPGFAGPFVPWFGSYAVAPARVSPPPADRLLMPRNADDLPRGNAMPGGEPAAVITPDPPDDDAELRSPRLRVANAAATARARQFIDYGDASFRKQEFARAYGRYRKAAESAPDLAETYFRQALAQSAIGQFMPAVKTIRRGLAIDPDWAQSPFRLEQLYPNRAAKRSHFERLAMTAGEQPESAELMFLLGVELYFDNQPARAVIFLERAAELGLDEKLWRGFLDSATRRGKRQPRGEEL